MLRKLTLVLATTLAFSACLSGTGPDTYFYNPDGESDEPTAFDQPAVPDGQDASEEEGA